MTRTGAHQKATAALAAVDARIDAISAELDALSEQDPSTRRVLREKAIRREARRALRTRKFAMARIALTRRFLAPASHDGEQPPGLRR